MSFTNLSKVDPRGWVFSLSFLLEFCPWVLVFSAVDVKKKPEISNTHYKKAQIVGLLKTFFQVYFGFFPLFPSIFCILTALSAALSDKNEFARPYRTPSDPILIRFPPFLRRPRLSFLACKWGWCGAPSGSTLPALGWRCRSRKLELCSPGGRLPASPWSGWSPSTPSSPRYRALQVPPPAMQGIWNNRKYVIKSVWILPRFLFAHLNKHYNEPEVAPLLPQRFFKLPKLPHN